MSLAAAIYSFCQAYPAYTAEAILAMPYRRFLALVRAPAEAARVQRERQYFRGAGAAMREWQEHGERWRRTQRPPAWLARLRR